MRARRVTRKPTLTPTPTETPTPRKGRPKRTAKRPTKRKAAAKGNGKTKRKARRKVSRLDNFEGKNTGIDGPIKAHRLLGARGHADHAKHVEVLQDMLVEHGFDDEALVEAARKVYAGRRVGRPNKGVRTVEKTKQTLDAALRARLASVERRTPLDHYVLWLLRQSKLIRDLEALKDSVREDVDNPLHRNHVAFINATKVQADLYDRIVKQGIDFKVIEREQHADKSQVGGVPAMRLEVTEVAYALKEEVTLLQTLLNAADTGTLKQHTRKLERRIARATVAADTATDNDDEQATVILQANPNERDTLLARAQATPAERRAAMRKLYTEGELIRHPTQQQTLVHRFPSLQELAERFGYANATVGTFAFNGKWKDARTAFLAIDTDATNRQARLERHERGINTDINESVDGDKNNDRGVGGSAIPEPTLRGSAGSPLSRARGFEAARRRDDRLILGSLRRTGPADGDEGSRLWALQPIDIVEATGVQRRRVTERLSSALADGHVSRSGLQTNTRYLLTEAGVARLRDLDAAAASEDEPPAVVDGDGAVIAGPVLSLRRGAQVPARRPAPPTASRGG